jgi:hypothetical protein
MVKITVRGVPYELRNEQFLGKLKRLAGTAPRAMDFEQSAFARYSDTAPETGEELLAVTIVHGLDGRWSHDEKRALADAICCTTMLELPPLFSVTCHVLNKSGNVELSSMWPARTKSTVDA